ncbi:MAG: nucleotide pyrophosphohydrolase [Myxococcota bacterium]
MSDTLAALAAEVRAFSDARDWGQFHSPRNLAMALSVEAAELLELFLWARDDEPQPAAARKDQVRDEAADVMICLLNFCDRSGIDLAAAVREKLAKAEHKYPVARARGRALKYHEYPEWRARAEAPSPDWPPEVVRALCDAGLPQEAPAAQFVARLQPEDDGYVLGVAGGHRLVLRGAEVWTEEGRVHPAIDQLVRALDAAAAGDPVDPADDPSGFWRRCQRG